MPEDFCHGTESISKRCIPERFLSITYRVLSYQVLSNGATNINSIKSHENYLGDEDAEVLCKASRLEAINALVCPLIIYFTNLNYKTMHITKQDSNNIISPCYTVATLHCCKPGSWPKAN
jgi:hypothetical protein